MKAKNSIKKDLSWVHDDTDELLMAILHLDNIAEARAFFRDLLSVREINDLANRWKIARMLHVKVSYQNIQRTLGVSSASVARTQRTLMRGVGGYQIILRKMDEKYHK
jgi:TrpR-related protein YerC/YecD